MSAVEGVIKGRVVNVPDFPKSGILFRDIMPLLADADAMRAVVGALAAAAPPQTTHVVAIEARGFLFGAPLAAKLGAGFVAVRKPDKLPRQTLTASYQLEYGEDSLQMQADALPANARPLLVDDLLATGGTLAAAAQLLEQAQAPAHKALCVIELTALNGRSRLPDLPIQTLAQY